MRIVRYELELVDYQQIQPLWPGRIIAVKPGRPRSRLIGPGEEPQSGDIPYLGGHMRCLPQLIDMWCFDAEIPAGEVPPTQVPVLGVWIVGTGNPMSSELARNIVRDRHDFGPTSPTEFQDTCVMDNGLVWHVFTKTVGYIDPPEIGYGEVSSYDDIVDQVAERRRAELQHVAEMPRSGFMQDPNA